MSTKILILHIISKAHLAYYDTCVASDTSMSFTCGNKRSPKKSVASSGSWVGMLSIEQIRTPGP